MCHPFNLGIASPDQSASFRPLVSPLVALPLGRRIPDKLHAVSCSLPTLRELVGYEERDPGVMRHVASGYPRFVIHPCLRELAAHLGRAGELRGRTLWLTSSERSAAALAVRLARFGAVVFHAEGVHGVSHAPGPEAAAAAHAFLQNTGMFLGSREAEEMLVRLGARREAEPEPRFAGDGTAEIRRVLRRALPAAAGADLSLACSGMNAIYAAFRAVSELQAARGRTIWVQLGWLYRDTIALLRDYTAEPERDYVRIISVHDLPGLERLFAERGDRIAGVFAEVPTNPLIRTPDLPALAALVRRHGARLVIDPSVVSPFCVDVLPWADVVVNSLTKYAACEGDLLAGVVAVNPESPDAEALRAAVRRWVEPPCRADVARLAREIGGWEDFLAKLGAAVPRVAAFLESHPKVKRVYWALAPDSRANYLRLARGPAAPGGLLSFTLKTPLAPFYDVARLPKGASFGMRDSLLCPFFYIAHYDLVKTEAGRAELAASGIDPELVRLSVGAEPVDEIIAALADALG